MHSAVDIARALLTNAEELGVSLSDSDLHRLAVHAQAWFMAGRERPLFGDPIVAGEDGPVIPAIREAQLNGGIARFADEAEGCDVLGEYAYWQTGSAILGIHKPATKDGPEINAEIDAFIAAAPLGCEIDREALRCRTREEIDKRKGPPIDPDALLRRFDEDPEFVARLLEKAARPWGNGFRPR